MLNLGQVVYDFTNQRLLIFGGVEMFQNQESGKCHAVFGAEKTSQHRLELIHEFQIIGIQMTNGVLGQRLQHPRMVGQGWLTGA